MRPVPSRSDASIPCASTALAIGFSEDADDGIEPAHVRFRFGGEHREMYPFMGVAAAKEMIEEISVCIRRCDPRRFHDPADLLNRPRCVCH